MVLWGPADLQITFITLPNTKVNLEEFGRVLFFGLKQGCFTISLISLD